MTEDNLNVDPTGQPTEVQAPKESEAVADPIATPVVADAASDTVSRKELEESRSYFNRKLNEVLESDKAKDAEIEALKTSITRTPTPVEAQEPDEKLDTNMVLADPTYLERHLSKRDAKNKKEIMKQYQGPMLTMYSELQKMKAQNDSTMPHFKKWDTEIASEVKKNPNLAFMDDNFKTVYAIVENKKIKEAQALADTTVKEQKVQQKVEVKNGHVESATRKVAPPAKASRAELIAEANRTGDWTKVLADSETADEKTYIEGASPQE